MIELKQSRTERTTDYDVGSVRVHRAYAGIEHYYNHDGRGDGEKRWRKCVIRWGADLSSLYGPYTVQAPATADGPLLFTNLRSDGKQTHNNASFVSRAVDTLPVPGVIQGERIIYADAFGLGSDLILELQSSGVARLVRVRAGFSPQPAYRFQFTSDKLARVVRLTKSPYELDMRGPKKIDTTATTLLDTGDAATFLQPFFAWSGAGYTPLSVDITRTTYGFDLVKTPPAWWDGMTDLYMDDTNTTTVNSDDNEVYKSNSNYATARNAATGALSSATATVYVTAAYKSGATYWIQRYFNRVTNTVPGGATIVSASMNVYFTTLTGTPAQMCILQGTQAAPIVGGDFDSFGATELTARVTPQTNTLGVFTLNAAGLALLSPGVENKFAFRDANDLDNVTPTGLNYAAHNTGNSASNKPYLEITYTPVGASVPKGSMGQLAAIKSLGVLAA